MLKVGIIGCGKVGVGRGSSDGSDLHYTHAGAYRRYAATKLFAAADVDSGRLQMCRQAWGVDCLYQNYLEMLACEKLDMVSVCVPDELHYPVMDAVITTGVRAIFCEKPFTLDPLHAKDIVRRCLQQKIILAVNHQRRWEPGHQRVRAAIANGELGKIQQIRGLYYGGLVHVGSHLVDLFRFFLGEVVQVELLDVVDPEFPSVDVRLRFQSGVPAILQACNGQHYEILEMDILGTLGRVQITELGHRIRWWQIAESQEYPGDRELGSDSIIVETRMRDAFLNGVEDIVQCLGSDRDPRSSGAEAVGTVEVLDRILAAARLCP